MNGKRLGNYQIVDKLGEGGMGEVWRARDERLNRTVALKILPPDVADDPARRARFEQEAHALGALNHPNIVSVYDTGIDDGRAYIVSELVEGESLRDVIGRGRLPLRKLIDIAVQIAEGMAAAHAVGIVHRDVKPENIMVTPSGRVKVLDFGLAKQTAVTKGDATATLALSQPGTVMGTAGYMSPEQVRGEPIDHRSDIFSFGAVLYEMITGKRAFEAGSSVETMHAILHADPPELEADTGALPPALGTIVRRCLEKRPDQRFQSAADLAFALRAIAPTTLSGAQKAVTAPVRRRWLVPLLSSLAAVLLFAAGYFLRDRTLRREPPRFQRITFREGLVTNARFTPDGRSVVYSANWDSGPGRVYLAIPGSPESRDLNLPDGAILAAVSSKEEIAIVTGPFSPNGAGTLSRVSISGGQMRPWLDDVYAADWAPDGSTMAVERFIDARYRLEYPIGKTLLDKMEFPVGAIRVSPDGNRVAYVHYRNGSSFGLSVIDTKGRTQFLGLVSGQISNGIDAQVCWRPDGREIWFRSFDPKEWGTVYAMDLKGRRRVVARVPGHITVYDIAHDGRMLLRTDTRQEGILGVEPGGTAERDLSCLDQSHLRGISSDGRVIAATTVGESGGPRGSIYLRKTDGSPPIRLGDGVAFTLSPDGKWVSGYTTAESGARRYVLLPTGVGEEREIAIPALKASNIVFGWSSDGQTLFVHGPGQKHGWQIYAWNPNSGELRPIGPEGVGDALALVSPDRQKFLTVGPDDRWWVYPVDGGPGAVVNGLSPHDTPAAWRADNRSLFITTHMDVNKTIAVSVLDIATGQRTPWKEIHPSRPVDQVINFFITPDGRAWAYNFLVKTSELYVADGVR